MTKFSLGVTCPNCGRDVILEGGLAPQIVRQSLLLRATTEAVQITCGRCGSRFALGPTKDLSDPDADDSATA